MPSDNKIDDKPNQQSRAENRKQQKNKNQCKRKTNRNEIMQNEFAFALSSFRM